MTVTIGPYYVAFSLTITNIASGPFQLYPILQNGTAPTGVTLTATPAILFTAKPIARVIIQNDPTNPNPNLVYIGDSTLTSTNKGASLPVSNSIDFTAPRGQDSWANGIYFNASVNTTVVNIIVIYG